MLSGQHNSDHSTPSSNDLSREQESDQTGIVPGQSMNGLDEGTNSRASDLSFSTIMQSGQSSSSEEKVSAGTASYHGAPQGLGGGGCSAFYEELLNQILQGSRVSASSRGQNSNVLSPLAAVTSPTQSTGVSRDISSASEDPNDEKVAAVASVPRQGVHEMPPVSSEPGEYDVLFGRGKRCQDHAGTKYMRHIADMHRTTYNEADRDDKTEMTWNIVKTIKANGGRFLKFAKESNSWVEVSGDVARKKVAHAMRDGRNKASREGRSKAALVEKSESLVEL